MNTPPKPPFRSPCNGCGLCCRLQLCETAETAFPGAQLPCPALEWEDGRAWCGMVRHPSRHLMAQFNADKEIGPLFAQAIAVGSGCGMEDDAGEQEVE